MQFGNCDNHKKNNRGFRNAEQPLQPILQYILIDLGVISRCNKSTSLPIRSILIRSCIAEAPQAGSGRLHFYHCTILVTKMFASVCKWGPSVTHKLVDPFVFQHWRRSSAVRENCRGNPLKQDCTFSLTPRLRADLHPGPGPAEWPASLLLAGACVVQSPNTWQSTCQ